MNDYTKTKAFRIRLLLRAYDTSPNASPGELAQLSKLSRNTVASYCDYIAVNGLIPNELLGLTDRELCMALTPRKRESDLHPVDHVEMELLRKKGWNKKQCYKRYLETVPAGAKAMAPRTFRKRLEVVEQAEPSMKLVYVAGDALMADYSGDKVKAISPFGDDHKYSIFVATLPCSQLIFAAVHEFERADDWIGGITDAIHAFGGVPRRIIPDNPKALVIKPRRGNTPAVLNPAFEHLCNHYQCLGDPARPGKPTDKSLAETAVNLIQKELAPQLNVRSRIHLEDLKALLAEVVDEINNRPMEKRQRMSRRDWFEKTDKLALKPISMGRHQFIVSDNTQQVSKQYRVALEDSTYSVPHGLVGQIAYSRITRTSVEILVDGKLVAIHPRARRPGLDLLIEAHMPQAHRARHFQQDGHMLAWADGLGDEVRAIVEFNLAAPAPGAAKGQRMQGLQNLQTIHGTKRFLLACQSAVAAGHLHYRIVKDMLENRREEIRPGHPPRRAVVSGLANVRGATYYAGRTA